MHLNFLFFYSKSAESCLLTCLRPTNLPCTFLSLLPSDTLCLCFTTRWWTLNLLLPCDLFCNKKNTPLKEKNKFTRENVTKMTQAVNNKLDGLTLSVSSGCKSILKHSGLSACVRPVASLQHWRQKVKLWFDVTLCCWWVCGVIHLSTAQWLFTSSTASSSCFPPRIFARLPVQSTNVTVRSQLISCRGWTSVFFFWPCPSPLCLYLKIGQYILPFKPILLLFANSSAFLWLLPYSYFSVTSHFHFLPLKRSKKEKKKKSQESMLRYLMVKFLGEYADSNGLCRKSVTFLTQWFCIEVANKSI